MANVKSVKRWFLVHKWTSLICTLFLLMLCLTGLPLVFYEEIEDLQGKAQAAPPMPEGTPMASLDDIIKVSRQQRPNDVVRYVYWDDEQPDLVMLNMADSINAPADVYKLLVFDARTAKVLQAPEPDKGFLHIMLELHTDMFAGILGKLFLGLMGILFVIAIISGVMLYGPIMRRYDFGMIRRDRSTRLKWLDMHNMLGIVILAWTFVVGITGVINTLSDVVLAMWQSGQLAEMVAPYKDKPAITGELSSLEAAVKRSCEAAPGMKPRLVAFPGTIFTSKHHYAVFIKGNTPVTSRLIKPALIDAQTGLLTDIRAMPWFVNTLFIAEPLHFGDYGGLPLKIIWALFDIATIVVLISGLYLWFARRKASEARINRILQSEAVTQAALLN
ncbi:PepSY-associated TM helix domain-containing protein [Chitinophaga rupis]|nr:PepSY domain-containing protein [Chitinophaga rupis]